jgi:Protein of unknown function (DUF4012)
MSSSTSDDNASANTASPFDAESSNDYNGRDVSSTEILPVEEHGAADIPLAMTDIPIIVENTSVKDSVPEPVRDEPTEPRIKAVKLPDVSAENKPASVPEDLNGHNAHESDETDHREASEEDGPASSSIENASAVEADAHGEDTPDTPDTPDASMEPEEAVPAIEDGEEEAKDTTLDSPAVSLEAQSKEDVQAVTTADAEGKSEGNASETPDASVEAQPEEDVPLAPRKNEARETLDESEEHKVRDAVVPAPAENEEEKAGSEAVATIATSTESEEEKAGGATVAVLAEKQEKARGSVAEAVGERPPEIGADLTISEQSTLSMYPLSDQRAQRRFTRYWILSVALLLLLLLSIATPLIVVASYAANAYATYNLLRAHAYGGVEHLLTVKTIFAGTSSHPTGLLDVGKLTRAQEQFAAAHDDFKQVQTLIDTTPLIHTITQYLPQYRSQVESARAASQVGIDTTLVGQQLISTALTLSPRFKGPLLSASHAPLITSADLTLAGRTIDAILPYLSDIQVQSQSISLGALPISESQRTQIQELFQMLPQVETLLQRGRDLLAPANWLLGVGQPRVFLVQTMDRAELRPTGGFTGQYGELSVDSGRVGPFSLHDISGVEYSDNSPTSGGLAPAAYRSWWPFENWGLRDSNLSADFPTSAQIAIKQYKLEVKRNVDGVVVFTPFFIEHILQAIGPIQIPKYNETITSQNLEDRLHYYQLDNAGIRKIEIVEHVNDPTQARKLFTSDVARILMDRVRHASPTELMALGLQVLSDLRTRDLQVYVTNPQVESLLEQYGYAGEIDRSNAHDGLYLVQANVSANKASQYVQTKLSDTVRLDAAGGAMHTLEMDLIYNQIGPVYGLDTYRDYVRIYVPQSAHLLSGNGFDTGVPLCGGPLAACSPTGVYAHQELVCPTGQYDAGASAPMIGDPYRGAWHPIDKIGPPDNTQSDEPGRAMFGGYIVVPKNCSMKVTVSWYVPPLGNGGYHLLLQRQASTYPALNLTVFPAAGVCDQASAAQLNFNGFLTADTEFLLSSISNPHNRTASCSLQQEAVTTSQQ